MVRAFFWTMVGRSNARMGGCGAGTEDTRDQLDRDIEREHEHFCFAGSPLKHRGK